MISKTLRLTNFILDTGVYLLLMIVFLMATRNFIERENVKWISLTGYYLYYVIFEYAKGQTIGKMITKSKVVSAKNDTKFSFIQISGRTLMRFIPIDIISYLFTSNGLHDRVSKTIIIKLQ